MNSKKALVVLSGGQDSTTCLAWALKMYRPENVYAVTFDYGQRHSEELTSAHVIASLAGLKTRHERIAVPDVLQGTSPLVNRAVDVERYADAASLPGGLEKTFVPMRNQLFLTLAANRAVCIALRDGAERVDIITGVSQEDYGGYPDCRGAFISAMGTAIGASLDAPALPLVHVVAPLMFLSKRDTVLMAQRLPGALGLLSRSHTCYNGHRPPCGKCHACLLRAKGFADAGVTDPLLHYLAGSGDYTEAAITQELARL